MVSEGPRGEWGGDEPPPTRPGGRWLEPNDPGNPFGVPLLDLMENLQLIAASGDPEVAARSMSWKPGMQRDIAIEIAGEARSCRLVYPAAPELPDGMLYRPDAMEDKWVIALRDGWVAAARSWTGETHAVARAYHTGDALELRSVTFADGSMLGALGDPVEAFDWLIRAHALGSRIPFPASAEGAEVLSAQPHLGFSFYGRQLFCAAVDYDLGAPAGRLHSDGDLVAAAVTGDAERLASALAAGAPVNAPTRFNHGAPALHLAVMLCPELIDPLLEAGADVNAATLRGSTPLMAATSAGADRAIIERLITAGADLGAADDAGFAAAHVAAQFGRVAALEALASHGASLSGKTKRGLEPIHVATGLGKREVVEWLIARGIDPRTPSPLGEPAEIAEQEGHPELAAALRSRAAR